MRPFAFLLVTIGAMGPIGSAARADSMVSSAYWSGFNSGYRPPQVGSYGYLYPRPTYIAPRYHQPRFSAFRDPYNVPRHVYFRVSPGYPRTTYVVPRFSAFRDPYNVPEHAYYGTTPSYQSPPVPRFSAFRDPYNVPEHAYQGN